MFLTYSDLLNSLDSGATTKITINNHRVKEADFEKSILMQMKGDGLDEYRKEYNDNLKLIQDTMGHADITTTLQIYADATADKKKESINSLKGKFKIR